MIQWYQEGERTQRQCRVRIGAPKPKANIMDGWMVHTHSLGGTFWSGRLEVR